MSSNLKTIDIPYYPFSNPTKRVYYLFAAFFRRYFNNGNYFLEYFDDTLRDSSRASKKNRLPALGMIPKMILDPGPFIHSK
jgi:hypothetical protein